MIICKDATVSFQYSLTDKDGNALDASPIDEPLTYIHGQNAIIPGLERELEGKKIDDVLIVNVKAKDAYGERQEQMVQKIPRANFQGQEIKVGMRFEAKTSTGSLSVVVKELTDEEVTVDGNHALAGKDLTFDVRIVDVRESTEKEINDCCTDSGCTAKNKSA